MEASVFTVKRNGFPEWNEMILVVKIFTNSSLFFGHRLELYQVKKLPRWSNIIRTWLNDACSMSHSLFRNTVGPTVSVDIERHTTQHCDTLWHIKDHVSWYSLNVISDSIFKRESKRWCWFLNIAEIPIGITNIIVI